MTDHTALLDKMLAPIHGAGHNEPLEVAKLCTRHVAETFALSYATDAFDASDPAMLSLIDAWRVARNVLVPTYCRQCIEMATDHTHTDAALAAIADKAHTASVVQGEALACRWCDISNGLVLLDNRDAALVTIIAEVARSNAVVLAAFVQFIAYDMNEAEALTFMLDTVHAVCRHKFCVNNDNT